jgi:hypothetical protein
LQFEREVFANTTFSAQYTMFRGSDLTRTRNANLSAPVSTIVPVYNGNTPTGETFVSKDFPTASDSGVSAHQPF